MRILVTGGYGFLGRAVTAEFVEAGHGVTVLTRQRPDTTAAPGVANNTAHEVANNTAHGSADAAPHGVQVVIGDVRDRRRMAEIIAAEAYDGIVHLAALTNGRESFADPLSYFDVNTAGTLNLLAALDAVRADRPPARFVFASTNIVYGSVYVGAFSEDLQPHPESPYAASKVAAEQFVGAYAATGAIAAVTLRPFNIAGAACGVTDTDRGRIIPNVLRTLTGELPHVTLNGDGTAVRDFVHVGDVAAAVRLAVEAAEPGAHAVYNVGSGAGTSMADIIRTVETTLGMPVPVVRNPPRPEPPRMIADTTLVRSALGWAPERSDLRRIIIDAWQAWRS